MKKALISPDETVVSYISGWTSDIPPRPVRSYYSNACRVAQVEDTAFDVAPPLYWIDCADNVTAAGYYFNTATSTIDEIVNAPYPPGADPL